MPPGHVRDGLHKSPVSPKITTGDIVPCCSFQGFYFRILDARIP